MKSFCVLFAGLTVLFISACSPPRDRPKHPGTREMNEGERTKTGRFPPRGFRQLTHRSGPAPALPSPIFFLVDTDGDRCLSAKEIEDAPMSLRKIDRNNDGVVTFKELLDVTRFGGDGALIAGGNRQQGMHPPGFGPTPRDFGSGGPKGSGHDQRSDGPPRHQGGPPGAFGSAEQGSGK